MAMCGTTKVPGVEMVNNPALQREPLTRHRRYGQLIPGARELTLVLVRVGEHVIVSARLAPVWLVAHLGAVTIGVQELELLRFAVVGWPYSCGAVL